MQKLILIKKNMLRVKRSTPGFTLIETLVAISVLLLSILGPISFAAQGIQNTYYARDQIVAFYMAQEGIELIRAQRDNNALAGVGSWLQGIDGGTGCETANGCGIEAQNPTTFVPCGVSPYEPCRLYYDSSGLTTPATQRGVYVLSGSGGIATTFVRRIQIQQVSTQEYDVISTVSWTTARLSKTIVVRSKIFDQYDNL